MEAVSTTYREVLGDIRVSLVSTYVEGTDGFWYKNPLIWNKKENWFLCFDDRDPIEIVIGENGPPIQKIVADLVAQGFKIRQPHKAHRAYRSYVGGLAQSYFLRFDNSLLPVKLIAEHDGKVRREDIWDACLYGVNYDK